MTGNLVGPWSGHPRLAMLHAAYSHFDRATLRTRLLELWERTGIPDFEVLADHRSPRPGIPLTSEQDFDDWVSTCLMDAFKNTGDSAVFALLFEVNRAAFLQAIQGGLRRAYHHIDAQDVVQEVFLNIYRYPHRFHADKADAFRGWGHRIARNTLLKFLKGQSRLARFLEMDEEVVQPEDVHTRPPDRAAAEAESAVVVNCAYVLYLQLYMQCFSRLSAKEQRALTMVEVEDVSYRDAADALGIRLENLKMVIFRGRRKIFRGMEKSLLQLGSGADTPLAPTEKATPAIAHSVGGVPAASVRQGPAPDRRIFHPSAASTRRRRDCGSASF